MKLPANLLWGLTRKSSSYRIKRGQDATCDFTTDPTSLTNLYNAQDAGVTDDLAIGAGVKTVPSKKGKGTRRVFTLRTRHAGHHGSKKQTGLVYKETEIHREITAASTAANKAFANVKRRDAVKARLYKLHKATRDNARKERALHKKN